MNIKFPKEIADFIEANASKYSKSQSYYFMPIYRKVSEGIYEEVPLNQVPNDILSLVASNLIQEGRP